MSAKVLHQLVDSLPSSWTPDKRKRWLEAVATAADYVVAEEAQP